MTVITTGMKNTGSVWSESMTAVLDIFVPEGIFLFTVALH
jgi:hypothetical protein